MKAAFITKYKDVHGVEPICAALKDTSAQVASSTYYASVRRAPSARAVADECLVQELKDVHAANYGVYGYRKMTYALRRLGYCSVGERTVKRLMRAAGLRGVAKSKSARTTIPQLQGLPGDHVRRQFQATAPNRLWVADITYVKTHSGWVFASFVMDLISRLIVGWQISRSLHPNLALDALDMGLWNRNRHGQDLTGLLHHSDRGVQYRAVRYTHRLEVAHVVASVGSKGDSYDNSAAEALNSLYISELIRNKGPWKGLSDVEIATAEWVDWYNRDRLHSELGHLPPCEYEDAYYAETIECIPSKESMTASLQ